MNLIELEIERETQKKNASQDRISKLNSMLNKKSVTFEEFQDSGRFMPMEKYELEKNIAYIHPECRTVVRYMGGFVIQIMKSGAFVYMLKKDESLYVHLEDDGLVKMEQKVWDAVANEKFNKEKK